MLSILFHGSRKVVNSGRTVFSRNYLTSILPDVRLVANNPSPSCKRIQLPVTASFGTTPLIRVAGRSSTGTRNILYGNTTLEIQNLTDDRVRRTCTDEIMVVMSMLIQNDYSQHACWVCNEFHHMQFSCQRKIQPNCS